MAVITEIEGWFEDHVFGPLSEAGDGAAAIHRMLDDVDTYFRSGRRVCLIGAFALADTRDQFAAAINGYFRRWIEALTRALTRDGVSKARAHEMAEDAVIGIQGALVLARAQNDTKVFARAIARVRSRLKG